MTQLRLIFGGLWGLPKVGVARSPSAAMCGPPYGIADEKRGSGHLCAIGAACGGFGRGARSAKESAPDSARITRRACWLAVLNRPPANRLACQCWRERAAWIGWCWTVAKPDVTAQCFPLACAASARTGARSRRRNAARQAGRGGWPILVTLATSGGLAEPESG